MYLCILSNLASLNDSISEKGSATHSTNLFSKTGQKCIHEILSFLDNSYLIFHLLPVHIFLNYTCHKSSFMINNKCHTKILQGNFIFNQMP